MKKKQDYVYQPRPEYELRLRSHFWGDELLRKPLPLVRSFGSWFCSVLVYGLASVAIIPLFSILWEILRQGLPGLSLQSITAIPAAPGITGVPSGFGHALLGTIMVVGVAAVVSIPIGILVGIYLAEFAQGTLLDRTLNEVVRFVQRILSSIPSIIVGVFAYGVIVYTSKKFSVLAGSFALMMIMLPIVSLTTEEAMKRVPNSLRLAAAALGGNKFQITMQIVFRSALDGITTGCLLAIARAAGETAPLIFTAFNSPSWPEGLLQPTASMPVLIFQFSTSSVDEQKKMAWTAALVLLLLVLLGNVASRMIIARRVSFK